MTRYSTALIVDSTSDLPEDILAQYGIQVIPLYLIWGSQQLRDRVDIQPTQFYERLVADSIHPTTSQPAIGDFWHAFEQAQTNGATDAVLFTISSGMSSTYSTAEEARQKSPIPVHVIDSKANSMSLGWQVLAAARARAEGGDSAAMIEAAAAVRRHLVTLLYVDTLDYLHKGGRITGLQKFIGTALDMKPQLYVNHETGKIEAGARTRTRKKALDKMIETFAKQLDRTHDLHIAVLHGNVPTRAEEVAEHIHRELQPAELIISMTSPVMGVHTGPGAIALCGYSAAP